MATFSVFMGASVIPTTLGPAHLQHLLGKYQHGPVWDDVGRILPFVYFEVMALGPDALLRVGKITAKVRLDDDAVYKIRFDHPTHEIQLCRMFGQKNGPPVATFSKQSTHEEIWLALHPRAARLHASQARARSRGRVFVPLPSRADRA